MRYFFAGLLKAAAIAALALGPGIGLRAQTTVTGTIRHGGLLREYRLYVPAIYTGSPGRRPLLFNLHGYGSNNQQQEFYGDFRPIADTANFLVVHPNGTFDTANNRNWNTFGPRGSGVDDVGFLSALLDTLSARYRVDPDRVYSTGMSNGGFMSYELACQLSGRVAAIASVTGSMTASRLSTCAAGRPVPVLEIHGTADGTVPYTGGTALQFVAVPTLLASWVQRNGCNPMPIVTPVPDTNTADGCTAERSVWTDGRNGSVVEHYRIIGGGHTWPGSAFTTGVTNRDISASREVWRFLRPYRLKQFALASPTAAQAAGIVIFPNPTAATVTVRLPATLTLRPGSLTVHDAQGRRLQVRLQPAIGADSQFSTAGWANGVYLLRLETTNGQTMQQKLMKE